MGGLWVSLLIVFMASCCTMVLELVAGRILAPFIGVSLYTWTSIIGVCLAGISAGNFIGGVLADKAGSRRTLGLILLGGGLFSLIILPLAAMDLTNIIPKESPIGARDFWLITRIVVVTALLFLPPTLILGMVSPIVIKLALTDLRQTGSIAGKIYAFSTVGSIVGTFLTGFYLVSAFGTRSIMLGVAIILIAMAFVFGDLVGGGTRLLQREVRAGRTRAAERGPEDGVADRPGADRAGRAAAGGRHPGVQPARRRDAEPDPVRPGDRGAAGGVHLLDPLGAAGNRRR